MKGIFSVNFRGGARLLRLDHNSHQWGKAHPPMKLTRKIKNCERFLRENWIIVLKLRNSQFTDSWEVGVFDNSAPFFSFTDFDYENKFAKLQRVKNQRAAWIEMETKGDIPKTVTSKKKRGTCKQKNPQKQKRNHREKRSKNENVQSRNGFRPLDILQGKFVRNSCSSSFRK